MRRALGWSVVATGVFIAVLTLGGYLYGLAFPVEDWDGPALDAYRYAQSASGLTCTAAGVMLAVFGGILVRGADGDEA